VHALRLEPSPPLWALAQQPFAIIRKAAGVGAKGTRLLCGARAAAKPTTCCIIGVRTRQHVVVQRGRVLRLHSPHEWHL
jgi:hypothetical protein